MDKEALFRHIVKENGDRIFRICSYFFRDESDCKDAFQEALIRIWQNLSSFRKQSQLSTWLYRVTVNTCLTFIRKDKTRKKIMDGMMTPAMSNIPDRVNAEEDLLTEVKLAFFKRFLEEIPAMDRMLVSLYLEELTSREMADITGLSESNIRVRIHRLKEKINTKWKEEQNGIR